VGLLYEKLKSMLAAAGWTYEIVFVDDGSADRTFELAKGLAQADTSLRVVRFRRNYGQTAAMAAGIQYARAEIIITMDGDLQNDPADIPAFVDKIDEGYDVVAGIRQRRQDKLITRRIPSKIANWLIGCVTGVPIKDNGCSLKAYRSSLIKSIPLYSDMHRFIPAMASLAGARIIQIPVKHHARQFGRSKYGLNRVYKVLVDLLVIKTIVGYCARPMLWFSLMAFACFGAATVSLAAAILRNAYGGQVSTVTMAGTSMAFWATGIFLFLLGVLADRFYATGDTRIEGFTRLARGSARAGT